MGEKRINEFTMGYMINLGLNVNRTFKEKVEKCMFTTFGAITQTFIKAILLKKNNNSFIINTVLLDKSRIYSL